MSDPEVLVACLCAQWCDICRDYALVFNQVAQRFPQMRFVWVDIEDAADLVDPVEVESFPTLLIACGAEPRFFGSLTPQLALLERILRERVAEADPALAARADIGALVARLRVTQI